MLYVGADLLSPLRSTIGAKKLNFRVRNENGCTPLAISTNIQHSFLNAGFLLIEYREMVRVTAVGRSHPADDRARANRAPESSASEPASAQQSAQPPFHDIQSFA